MDRHIPRPKDLTVEPNAVDAAKVFKYWLRTVEDYIATLEDIRERDSPEVNKTRVIRSFLSPDIYPHIEEESDFASIVKALKDLYEVKRNNIYARHLLISRQQAPGEKVLEYLRALKLLAKDCSFQDARASKYRDELIRNSFINGLTNPSIRQRLWKMMTLISSMLLILLTASNETMRSLCRWGEML